MNEPVTCASVHRQWVDTLIERLTGAGSMEYCMQVLYEVYGTKNICWEADRDRVFMRIDNCKDLEWHRMDGNHAFGKEVIGRIRSSYSNILRIVGVDIDENNFYGLINFLTKDEKQKNELVLFFDDRIYYVVHPIHRLCESIPFCSHSKAKEVDWKKHLTNIFINNRGNWNLLTHIHLKKYHEYYRDNYYSYKHAQYAMNMRLFDAAYCLLHRVPDVIPEKIIEKYKIEYGAE